MRVIVHAGMHKTGSSSIQQTLHKHAFPGITYAPWRSANHSALSVLLFGENPESYHGFKSVGAGAADLRKLKAHWQDKLDRAVDACRDTLVFSAEAISSSTVLDAQSKGRLVDYFRQYSDDVELVAYIRPPAGFMQSTFQQRVRGSGLGKFKIENLWPNYRQRFEPLFDLFNQDQITLRVFDRQALDGQDVVKDFFGLLNTDIPADRIISTNESLSLEATSLLYTQRRLGHGLISGFPKAMAANARFIKAIEGFGKGKLRFAREALLPIFEENADDLAWMENKLGRPITDLPEADTGDTVACEEDFFEIAECQADALAALLSARVDQGADPRRQALSRDLDLLYLDAIGECFGAATRETPPPQSGR